MTSEQIKNNKTRDDDFVLSNEDLLDILRGDPSFSVDQYGGLDGVLENLKNGLGEFISGFVREDVEISLSTVAIYTDEYEFSGLGQSLNFTSHVDGYGELILCVGMASSSLRQLLRSILGKTYRADSDKQSALLSGAENKLFQRFSCRLCSAFCRLLDAGSESGGAAVTDFKSLNKVASEQELIVLTFDVAFAGSKFPISILTQLDLLEPTYVQPAPGGASNDNLGPGGAPTNVNVWADRLSEKIDQIEIPLCVQLGARRMHLIDVAKLKVGSLMEFEFGLANVEVTDRGENKLFLADLEIREHDIVFGVTGSATNL